VETLYSGPPIDDPQLLSRLPANLALMLETENGFVAANGGFHVRGACLGPLWHSMRAAWEGEMSLNRLYPLVRDTDIPIAEDCFGDQYLIRDGSVMRLIGETGEVEDTRRNWDEFMDRVENDPIEFLQLSHFVHFQQQGGLLSPGQLLSVYPPFVAAECINPSIKPIPAIECRTFLADFARQIQGVPDGKKIEIRVL
jgi:hypothetical protein